MRLSRISYYGFPPDLVRIPAGGALPGDGGSRPRTFPFCGTHAPVSYREMEESSAGHEVPGLRLSLRAPSRTRKGGRLRDVGMTQGQGIGESLPSRIGGVVAALCAQLATALSSSAGEEILGAASYPDMTTYSCRTDALPIRPGRTSTSSAPRRPAPTRRGVSGPGDTSPFDPGSTQQGYITRFKPSMVEITTEGARDPERLGPAPSPRRLAHSGGSPTFASGEEKTEVKLPQGYGIKVGGDADLGPQLHDPQPQRRVAGAQVYITWEIDWVPETDAGAHRHQRRARSSGSTSQARRRLYPVFDAERGFDTDGDGDFVFPDDVRRARRARASRRSAEDQPSAQWTVPPAGRTLVFGAGHLHPGGTQRRPPGRARRRRRRARSTATTRRRSSRSSAPTPSTTSPPARSAGT